MKSIAACSLGSTKTSGCPPVLSMVNMNLSLCFRSSKAPFHLSSPDRRRAYSQQADGPCVVLAMLWCLTRSYIDNLAVHWSLLFTQTLKGTCDQEMSIGIIMVLRHTGGR